MRGLLSHAARVYGGARYGCRGPGWEGAAPPSLCRPLPGNAARPRGKRAPEIAGSRLAHQFAQYVLHRDQARQPARLVRCTAARWVRCERIAASTSSRGSEPAPAQCGRSRRQRERRLPGRGVQRVLDVQIAQRSAARRPPPGSGRSRTRPRGLSSSVRGDRRGPPVTTLCQRQHHIARSAGCPAPARPAAARVARSSSSPAWLESSTIRASCVGRRRRPRPRPGLDPDQLEQQPLAKAFTAKIDRAQCRATAPPAVGPSSSAVRSGPARAMFFGTISPSSMCR